MPPPPPSPPHQGPEPPELSRSQVDEADRQHTGVVRQLNKILRAPIAKMASSDLATTQRIANVSKNTARCASLAPAHSDRIDLVCAPVAAQTTLTHLVTVPLQVPVLRLGCLEREEGSSELEDQLPPEDLRPVQLGATQDCEGLRQCEAPQRAAEQAGRDGDASNAALHGKFEDQPRGRPHADHHRPHGNHFAGMPLSLPDHY